MDNSIFKKKVYKHIKRLLGFIDIEVDSVTFGCADRYYWHYKLHDYHNARYQEAVLILSFVYLDQASFLYKNQKLLNLIKGIINFWLNNLNRNGSVNEIYPYEQSFCATSFSSYVITEAIFLLGLQNEFQDHKRKFKKVGNGLAKNGNWHIANQISASAVALHNLGILINEKEFINESENRINFLLKNYEKEEYFSEYGGFDLGYNTLTMSCLARIYQKTQNNRILEVLNKSNEYLDKYLDEYARYDNINMSRNTQFVYPFSFKATKSPILEKIKKGIENDLILNPDWLDDRYLIGLANDYLMTYFY